MGWGQDNFRKSGKLTWLLRRYFRYLSGNPARGGVSYHSWPLQTGNPLLYPVGHERRGCHPPESIGALAGIPARAATRYGGGAQGQFMSPVCLQSVRVFWEPHGYWRLAAFPFSASESKPASKAARQNVERGDKSLKK
jgi:hypothetical protein